MVHHKRHVGAVIILGLFLIPSSGFTAYSAFAFQKQILANNETIAAETRRIEELQKIHKDRLAEEARIRAKLEAEAKAASEAAAKAASQQTGVTLPTSSKTCNTSRTHANPAAIDVVVNKKHCLAPLTYTPQLVTVSGATISPLAETDFTAMLDAATTAGLPLSVTSSFRSYDNQVGTYNYWVGVNGSAAAADKVSARPGYSEHQTGLAIDLAAGGCALECFARTAQKQWLVQHAHEYGFVERYPAGKEAVTGYSPEAWHYRYVGKVVASDMRARGVLTLEEYWDIEGGDY